MARLPYDYDRLQGDNARFTERDWRSTPRVKTNRDLDKLMDELSMLMANEICDGARKSAAQTFYFNMMSRNDFNNEDFRNLMQFACDALEYQVASRALRSYTENIQDNLYGVMSLHCSKQIDDHRELLDIAYDQDGAQNGRALQANCKRFHEVVDAIEQFQGEDQRDIRRDSRDDRYSDSRDRGRDSRDHRDSRGFDDRRDRRDSRDSRDDRGWNRDGGSRGGFGSSRSRREEPVVSGREAQQHNEVSTNAPRRAEDMFVPLDKSGSSEPKGYRRSSEFFADDRGAESRNATMDAREAAYAPPPAPVQAQAPVVQVSTTESRRQPRVYVNTPTAPCPPPPVGSRQEDAHLWDLKAPPVQARASSPEEARTSQPEAAPEVIDNAVPTEVTTAIGTYNLVRFNDGKSQMDALEHAAVYPAGSKTPGVNMRDEVQRVLTLEQAVVAPILRSEQIEGSSEVMDSLEIFSNVTAMVHRVSEDATMRIIEDSGENQEGVRKIYHAFAVVDNAIVGFQHLNVLQNELRTVSNIRDILNLLRRTVEAVNNRSAASDASASDLRAAVSRFDRLITREVNVFVREVLKLSDGDIIRSAIAQFDELTNFIQDDIDVGAAERQSAFLVFISRLSASIADAQSPTLSVEKHVIASSGVDTDKHGVAMLPVSYLCTHLPFTLEELGIERTGSAVVTEAEFSAFLRAALDVSKIEDESLSAPLRLMVTRDMEVFRIYHFPGRRNATILVPLDAL